jgi:hypothetical protein
MLRVLLLLLPAVALAQEPPPAEPEAQAPPSALELRLEALEQQHRLLEQRLALSDQKAAEEKKKGVTFSAAPGKGFDVITNDGRFGLQIRTRAQIRDTVLVTPKATTNEINVKTLRLFFSGHVLVPDLRYVIQLALGSNDFENGNPSPIFDAYLEYNKLRDLNIRFGQFFVPFDRARTIREFALQFVDRQVVVTELTLDRDVGVMFHSNDLGGKGGKLSYAIGIFGGEGRNKFGVQNPGFLYTLRFAVRPMGAFDDDVEGDLQRIRKPRLMIGAAGAFNQATNRARSTTGNTLTLGGYDYAHAAGDLVFKYAGFSLLAEIVYRKALWSTRVGLDDKMMPLTEYSRSGWGYLVQAGMMVSRMVELTARWNQLMVLAPTDPALVKLVDEQGKEAGGGINVYLNGHFFKLQADYFYVFGKIEDQGRHQVRVQLDATF